jgi:KaiC/GvpD/RAD55 family RecA-like ATPase
MSQGESGNGAIMPRNPVSPAETLAPAHDPSLQAYLTEKWQIDRSREGVLLALHALQDVDKKLGTDGALAAIDVVMARLREVRDEVAVLPQPDANTVIALLNNAKEEVAAGKPLGQLEQVFGILDAVRRGSSASAGAVVRAWKTYAEIEKDAEELAKAPRTPLFLSGLDDYLGGGVRSGQPVIFGAFTTGGKTSILVYEAMKLSERGHPVFYATAEPTPAEIVFRMKTAQKDFRPERFSVLPTSYDFKKDLDQARRWIDEHDSSEKDPVVEFDYLQKFAKDGTASSREREVAQVAEAIQKFAQETGAVTLIAAQLNRKAREVKPDLSHFRESGLIEQVAEVAILLAKTGETSFWTTVAKHRGGPTGKEFDYIADWTKLIFNPSSAEGAKGFPKTDSQKKPHNPSLGQRIVETLLKYHGTRDEKGELIIVDSLFVAGKLDRKVATINSYLPELQAQKKLTYVEGGGAGKYHTLSPISVSK